MKIFNQLALILCIWVLGEYLSLLVQDMMVIPGSIIGMVLLFICLKFKLIRLESIKEISDFFLDNMAIFFVPAGVSLMSSLDIISENIFVLVISIVVSTILVMYITGIVVEKMISKKLKENKDV